VWLDRPAALINGVELDENGRRVATVDDNARSVEQWQAHNALEELVVGMEASGELAKSGFTAQELLSRKWKDARTELVRVLSVQNMVTAMSVMKSAQEKRNWDEKVLPASSVQVMPEQEEGGSDWSEAPASVRSWTYEVLDKDDPRGFTIGPDTGCCMTVRGKARSCITAGYELKNAGFVALYDPDGRLAAQSFWFVHPDSPDKLVMDNIEAVKGRNMHKILGLYRQGIEAVLKNASEHSDASLIRYAQVGEGCTKVDLGDLDRVDSVPKLDDAIYSDARHQRLLLDMHAR
jgi:hypothetical protein